MSPDKVLPAAPSLEHLKDQADKLSRAFDRGDPGARVRVRALDTLRTLANEAGAALTVAQSQLMIAREYGFPSWPALKAHVESRAPHPQEAPMTTTPDALRKDLFNFALTLASLQRSGVRIVRGFEIATDAVVDPGLKKALIEVRSALREGQGVSDPLKKHPRYFDATFINLVIAGEETGRLDEMLERLAGLIEKGGAPTPLLVFTRQLSVMVSTGLPLTQAVSIISEGQNDAALAGVLPQVAQALKGGANFPEALAAHPEVFNSFYVEMTRAGDQGGNLDVLLLRIADQMERSESFTSR